MKNFIINLSVVAFISGGGSYFITSGFTGVGFDVATLICIYFFIITVISHYIITETGAGNRKTNSDLNQSEHKGKHSGFVTRFMLATSAKLLFSASILFGYVFYNRDSAVSFILLFALNYFLFTAFEVFSLNKYFRSQK